MDTPPLLHRFGLRADPFPRAPGDACSLGTTRGPTWTALLHAPGTEPGLVVAVGEPGAGETVLCRRLGRALRDRFVVLRIDADALRRGSPEELVHAALARRRPGTPADVGGTALRARLGALHDRTAAARRPLGAGPVPPPSTETHAMSTTTLEPIDAHARLVEPTTLTPVRRLPGPAERVWHWLTEAEPRGQWLADGAMAPEAGTDFELVWRDDPLSASADERPEGCPAESRATCRVVEIDAPRRLRFEWPSIGDVALELAPKSADVLLTVVHRRLRDTYAARFAA